jgi:hypothetical protein
MIRLLDSCIRTLASHGMRKLFTDAVKGGDQGFKELGTWHRIQAFWAPAENMARVSKMGGIQRSLARYLTQSEAGVTVLFIPWSRSYMHIAAQSSACWRIALGMGRRIYVLVPDRPCDVQ